MAKVKFNVKGVSSGGGEPIPKGTYLAEVDSCQVTHPDGKDERIEVVYSIKKGEQAGRKLYDYINLESEAAAWKLRQFLETFGLVNGKKETGSFDPEDLVGKDLNLTVTQQQGTAGTQWEGQVQSRVGRTWEAETEDEEDLEDEADEDEDEDEDEEEDEEADEDEVDLDEMDRDELKAYIKQEELGIRVTKSRSDDDIRAAIVEAAEAEGEDEEDEEDEDEDEPDYDSMDADELRETLKERGLSVKGSAKIMRARLVKSDEDSDGDPF